MSVIWFWTLLVLFQSTSSLLLPNIRLTDSCPSSYSIRTSTGSVLGVEVKDTVNACDRIPKLSKRKDVQVVNDLSPSMVIGSQNDRMVVNISWAATAIGNKLPRMILLELTKYVKGVDGYAQSKDCVLLRLRNRKLERHEPPPNLFFDCVELVKDIETYLCVQVWCLPNSASVTRLCQTRHKRSLPNSRTCQKVSGNVICSEDKLFPLSIESHIAGICHCSDRPDLSLSRLDNGSFQLDAWNLPQFAYEVKFTVLRGLDTVYTKIMAKTTRFNESRSVITERTFGPGNYTLVVSAECGGDKADIRHSGRNCPTMDSVQLDYPLEVPYPPTTSLYEFQPAVHTLLPIGGAIILSCLVTITVFCIRRKQKKEPQAIELQPLSSENNAIGRDESSILIHARLRREKMLVFHPDDRYHEACITKLRDFSEQFELLLVPDIPTDTELNTDADVNEEMHFVNGTSGIRANWRDFAEKAGTDYTEIVIVMSRGLYQICEAYRNKTSEKDALDALRRERQYEIIPCIVLQKLQTLIQESPETDSFSIHIISFETDTTLIEEFLYTFDFLKRYTYCFIYCLPAMYKDQTGHDNSVGLNVADMELLLRRLKGLTEYEEGYSAIDTVFLNQNCGRELSHALHYRLLQYGSATGESSV